MLKDHWDSDHKFTEEAVLASCSEVRDILTYLCEDPLGEGTASFNHDAACTTLTECSKFLLAPTADMAIPEHFAETFRDKTFPSPQRAIIMFNVFSMQRLGKHTQKGRPNKLLQSTFDLLDEDGHIGNCLVDHGSFEVFTQALGRKEDRAQATIKMEKEELLCILRKYITTVTLYLSGSAPVDSLLKVMTLGFRQQKASVARKDELIAVMRNDAKDIARLRDNHQKALSDNTLLRAGIEELKQQLTSGTATTKKLKKEKADLEKEKAGLEKEKADLEEKVAQMMKTIDQSKTHITEASAGGSNMKPSDGSSETSSRGGNPWDSDGDETTDTDVDIV